MNTEQEVCEICLKVKHIADMQIMVDGEWICNECISETIK